MIDRCSRHLTGLLALLCGVLVAAWAPAEAQRASLGGSVRAAVVDTWVAGSHGTGCPPHAAAWAPASTRSPSWHRGTGRRSSRTSGGAPIPAAAGSIPAVNPLTAQHEASGVRCLMPSTVPGRSAASPRAPPAVR